MFIWFCTILLHNRGRSSSDDLVSHMEGRPLIIINSILKFCQTPYVSMYSYGNKQFLYAIIVIAFTSAKARRICDQVGLTVISSFCVPFCVQDYCTNNQSISLKLAVMIGAINRKNFLTFCGDAVPDTNSRSLFHFPHHCRILDIRRFIRISHTVTPSYFYDTLRNDWRRQGNESTTTFW